MDPGKEILKERFQFSGGPVCCRRQTVLRLSGRSSGEVRADSRVRTFDGKYVSWRGSIDFVFGKHKITKSG